MRLVEDESFAKARVLMKLFDLNASVTVCETSDRPFRLRACFRRRQKTASFKTGGALLRAVIRLTNR